MADEPTRSLPPEPEPDPAATRSAAGATGPTDATATNSGGFAARFAALGGLDETRDATATGAPPVAPDVPGYEVLDELGRGGMGVVYKARELALNRTVALKMVLAGPLAHPSARARFLIEAESVAAVQHPGVVQVFAFGDAAGHPYLALEFLPGGTLADRIKQHGPLAPREAATVALALAEAVAAAHAAGVVHRDLKPGNVLLTATGEPKVTDFGLAKVGRSDVTATGAVLGTPSYMAPEQAAGKTREVGTAADVYGLGAILYDLLTGRPPFKGDSQAATLQLVLTTEPVRPRGVNTAVPRDLETVCLRCLEKDPAKRYPTAEALADDLRRFLAGEPVVARPVGKVSQAWRWCRRNKAVASLLATVLVVFAAGAGVATFFAVEEGKRAKEADDREADANEQRNNVLTEQDRTEELLYSSLLFQAHAAAKEFRTDRFVQHVDKMRPRPGRPDRRGWEWHYLNRLARSWDSEHRLDVAAPGVAFDPSKGEFDAYLSNNGERVLARVLSTDESGELLGGGVFDAASGRLIRSYPKFDGLPLVQIWDTGMSADGKFVAFLGMVTGAMTSPVLYRVQLWNAETGRVEKTFPDFKTIPGTWVSSDGARVVIVLALPPSTGFGMKEKVAAEAEAYPRIEVWDRGQDKPMPHVIRVGKDQKPAIVDAVSPDGKTAAVLYSVLEEGASKPGSNRLEFWNIAGVPTRIGSTHIATSRNYATVSFSPNGRSAVTASEGSRAVEVFDTRSSERTGRWEVSPELSPLLDSWSVVTNDEGTQIALAGPNGIVVVADANRLNPPGGVQSPVPPGPDGWHVGVTYRAPGRGSRLVLAPGGQLRGLVGQTLYTWSGSHPPGYAASWPIPQQGPGQPLPNPDQRGRWASYAGGFGSGIPSESLPRKVLVYDARQHRVARTVEVRGADPPSWRVSPDGQQILLSSASAAKGIGRVYRFSLRNLSEPARVIVRRDTVTAPDFSEDGRWVVFTDPSGIWVWRTRDGRETFVPDPTPRTIGATWVAPEGRFVVATHGILDGENEDHPPVPLTFTCYDPETGQEQWNWSPASLFTVKSPSTSMPAEGQGGANLPVEQQGRLGPTIDLPHYFFSPEGRKLGIVKEEENGSVKVWVLDMASGARERELTLPPRAEGRATDSNAFGGGPRGARLAKGAFGSQGHLAVWVGRDVVVWGTEKPDPIHRMTGHDVAPLGVVFNHDGTRLFSLDSDGKERDWIPGDERAERTLRVWELVKGTELLTIRIPIARPANLPPNSRNRNSTDRWANEMWMEGERLMVRVSYGVRVFDGTPRPDAPAPRP